MNKIGRPRRPARERFWNLVIKGPDCWEWSGCRHPRGYGLFSFEPGSRQLAHRVVWQLINGMIPPSLCVLHRCDNPPCVRPEHLFLGTQCDNMKDMAAKGRSSKAPRACGSRSGMAVLNEGKVRNMRFEYRRGAVSYAKIARKFMVSKKTARSAIIGETWRHVQ